MVKIKRENGSVDKIFFALRLLDVENEKVSRISVFFNRIYKIDTGPLYNDKKFRVLLVEELDTYDDYSKIVEMIEKFNIKKEQLNITISMTSEYDMSGFTIPEKVSNLFLKIGGSIDFSIIII